MNVVPIEPTRVWAGVAGRAVHRSLVFASPGAARRRSPKFAAGGVPLPSRTPAMGAHVALDELVVGGFHALRGGVSPEELERIDAEADDAIAHFRRAGWLDDPRSYHLDPSEPIAPSLGRRWVGRTRFETLRFDSGWEPRSDEPGAGRWAAYESNRRVRVLVLRHRGEPRPWVVCVHGAEMGGRPLIDTRILRAEHLHRALGLNVAIPVLPMHGPRRPRPDDLASGAAGFPGLDLIDDVHGLAQATWDVRRLIAWIRSQHATGVALSGFSLGGYVAALVTGLEHRLDAVVAGCPAVDLPSLFRGAPAEMRREPRFESLMGKADVLLRVVSPLAFTPATPADRCFIYGGLADRLAHPVEQASALARHWGDAHVLWFAGGHVSHTFNGHVSAFVDDALRSSL